MFYDSTVEVPIKCHAWPVAADFFSYFLILHKRLHCMNNRQHRKLSSFPMWYGIPGQSGDSFACLPSRNMNIICWSLFARTSLDADPLHDFVMEENINCPRRGMAWWRLHVLFVNNDCLMRLMLVHCKWVPAVDVLDLCQRGIGTSYKSMKCLPAIPCHWITTPRLHSATQDRVWSPQFISKHGRKTG